MKEKKVLFVGSYYPTLGGAEKYLYDITLNRGDFNESVILCPKIDGECPKDPCKVVRANTLIKNKDLIKKLNILEYVQNYSFILPAYFKGKKIIKEENIKIIHSQFGLSFGIVGYLLKKSNKKPLVLTLHGSGFNFKGWRKIFKPITKKILLSADKIIAVSNSILNEAKKIADVQGEVIYNSVNLKEFKNLGDKNYILAVGRLAKMKGFNILISAAKELPNYNFIIVGEGPERKSLEEQIIKYRIKNVTLVGQKSQEETRKFISECSILAMPSLFGEGLPFALVEAIASGKPVIGSDIRGIPEVIHGNGILIKPNDIQELKNAIETLMKYKKLREKMGKKSKIFAEENFDLKKGVKRLNKIYEEVLR
ncbi:glycosyltransferase family 4 protein [Candidatus Woesearchaeota archaeon]|nr:glycosyltransferase family 4 protein [Candidatus Woesearchaeota archaeon]